MFPFPKKFIGTFRLSDPNALSPIPEIPNSACISPELSPGSYFEPTSKSAKVISPSQKLKKIRKSEKLDLNFRFDKKLKKIPKKHQDQQGSDINSLKIYLKNKKEVLRLIPQCKEKMRSSLMHFSKSPERPDSSLSSNRNSRRGSVERSVNENCYNSKEKLPEFVIKAKESKAKIKKPVKKLDAILKSKMKKHVVKDLCDLPSKEIQNITRNLLQKKNL